jgi:RHS repeat-associated protein
MVPAGGQSSNFDWMSAGQNICFAYDSFGNRTAQGLQSAACPARESSVTPTASYNANNQVTWTTVNSAVNGFAYDAAGNVANDNVNTYLYDPEGRVCAVMSTPIPSMTTMTGYLYDAEGNRIAKGTIATWGSCDPAVNGFQLTESYVLGQGGEQMSTFDGGGNWKRSNVYGAGKLLATYDSISDPSSASPVMVAALHFHITDPLGTRRVQTDPNGIPETNCESLPYGDQLNCLPATDAATTADDATPLHFTGKERDTESGLDYFGASYYASSMGRFMSPDWSKSPQAVPYADLENPQSLNLYAYVNNNPLSRVDADGHCGDGWHWLCSVGQSILLMHRSD